MHATTRETLILAALEPSGFVTYRELEARLDASPATIRRDLTRMEAAGQISRVHGGAKLAERTSPPNRPSAAPPPPCATRARV